MPKLVEFNELRDNWNAGDSSTNVLKVTLNDEPYFYKPLLTALPDVRTQKLRVLNEAICGKIVEIINKENGSTFSTPVHSLVLKDSHLCGLLSRRIGYICLSDLGTAKVGLIKALETTALSSISTLRFVLCDPDGTNNVGYDEEKLASIDYGLANYHYLEQQDALLNAERNRLPECKEGEESVFALNPKNILTGSLRPVTDVEFLTHHVFSDFHEDILELSQDEETSQLVERFFSEKYITFSVISNFINSKEFKKTIIHELCINQLTKDEQAIASDILNSLIARGLELKIQIEEILKKTSDALMESVNSGDKDGRVTPFSQIISRSSPYLAGTGSREPTPLDLASGKTETQPRNQRSTPPEKEKVSIVKFTNWSAPSSPSTSVFRPITITGNNAVIKKL